VTEYQIIEVIWIDSAQSHGWKDRQAEIDSPDRLRSMRCRSVGYMLADDEHGVMLAESLSDYDNVACTTTIPKFAIVERRNLTWMHDMAKDLGQLVQDGHMSTSRP
jgi:hypothetical protein